MPVITLLSDFGLSDHFAASVKAKILSLNPSQSFIDISHSIELGNYLQASYIFNSCFKDFPQNTIHLFSINSLYNRSPRFIAVLYKDMYFIGPDNGFLGLIISDGSHKTFDINLESIISPFPAKDILAPAAAKLSSGIPIESIGKERDDFERMMPISLRATKEQIIGTVIFIDIQGNLVTNIDFRTFEILSKDKKFELKYGREYTSNINILYSDVEPGDSFVLFNSSGFLEIGINQGNASNLLGLDYNSPIIVKFQ